MGSFALYTQEKPKNTEQKKSKSGLLFEHGGYRGSGYTDSLGTNYNFRQNPITITNDTTVPIHIQIAFSKEYDYTKDYDDEQFKVFPLPKEWARERITDSMYNAMHEKLPLYINNPTLNETIEPGEKISLAIGTIYPLPAETWWVVPSELFAYSNGDPPSTCTFPNLDWLMNENLSPNSEIALGLKLHLDERCMIIPCGQISYPEH